MRELLAYSQGTVIEEKLALRIRANNDGDIYLPVAGYSVDGTQNCAYDWKVSIDGGEETTYTGVGSSNGAIRVGYGLNPLSVHTVIVKPNVEKYGWLRAFGYKGTSYASSLINIISDKSYKGYANSDVFSGDYYKAYQYYGCVNLINTDEELLPDTLEVIGDYYRYYEYAGCSKLVNNAEERILKTVKVIGNYYRAYQYENCESINKINMRAINWASVGSNYRYNQYSGIATEKKPANIYIEGGIEEGGDWGLANLRVKNIYVYKDLVSDYQTKLSGITSSKIQKNAEWDSYEYEFIEYIGLADSSGKIRVPVAGFSTSFTQDCAYDWMVSIDGEEAVEITGTGGQTYVSLGSGLIEGSEHRVVIKPKAIGWGWGRAFGFLSSGAQGYIKEIIHDSYKCYASGRVDTGAHYKHGVFAGCTNLINSYEKLPTSVTTVGDYYMKECYAGCTGLKTAFWEVMHYDAVIGTDYRYHEYTGCISLEAHQGIAGYTGSTYPTNYKYEYLSGSGNNIEIYITRYEELNNSLTNSLGIADNKVKTISCFVDDILFYSNNSNWSNINGTPSKWKAYYYGYVYIDTTDIDKYTTLVGDYTIPSFYISGNYEYYPSYTAPGTGIMGDGNDIYTDGRVINRGNGRVLGGIFRLRDNGEQTLSSYGTVMENNGGANQNGFIGGFYLGNNGEIYDSWGFVRSSSPYVNIHTNTGKYWEENKNFEMYGKMGLAVSRNNQYIFIGWKDTGVSYGRRLYRIGDTIANKNNINMYKYIDFSEDGMTAYLGTNDTKIIQYNLKSPRDLTDMVSSGKELSINGGWGFSKDKKYLYVRNGNNIKKYMYTE